MNLNVLKFANILVAVYTCYTHQSLGDLWD